MVSPFIKRRHGKGPGPRSTRYGGSGRALVRHRRQHDHSRTNCATIDLQTRPVRTSICNVTRAGIGRSATAGTSTGSPVAAQTATYTRPHGVRHLLAADDPQKGKLYGHVQTMKNRTKVLEFCKYLRSLHPSEVRMAIVCDNVNAPDHDETPTRRSTDGREQSRDRIHPDDPFVVELYRIAGHRVVVLRTRRHRPRQSPRQSSMVHRYVTWRNMHGRTATNHRRQRKRCVMLHERHSPESLPRCQVCVGEGKPSRSFAPARRLPVAG